MRLPLALLLLALLATACSRHAPPGYLLPPRPHDAQALSLPEPQPQEGRPRPDRNLLPPSGRAPDLHWLLALQPDTNTWLRAALQGRWADARLALAQRPIWLPLPEHQSLLDRALRELRHDPDLSDTETASLRARCLGRLARPDRARTLLLGALDQPGTRSLGEAAQLLSTAATLLRLDPELTPPLHERQATLYHLARSTDRPTSASPETLLTRVVALGACAELARSFADPDHARELTRQDQKIRQALRQRARNWKRPPAPVGPRLLPLVLAEPGLLAPDDPYFLDALARLLLEQPAHPLLPRALLRAGRPDLAARLALDPAPRPPEARLLPLLDLLYLEDADSLILLPGIPPQWLLPQARLSLEGLRSRFGTFSLRARCGPNGRRLTLELDPPSTRPPQSIEARLPGGRRLPLADAKRPFVLGGRDTQRRYGLEILLDNATRRTALLPLAKVAQKNEQAP